MTSFQVLHSPESWSKYTTLLLLILYNICKCAIITSVLYNIFQYPTGNFPASTEFWEFFSNFPEISNSGTPVSFSGLRCDGKWPVPKGRTETGPGSGCTRMLGMGKIWFPGNGIWQPRPLTCSLRAVTVTRFRVSKLCNGTTIKTQV